MSLGCFFSKHHLKPVCLDVFQVSFYLDLWDDMDILSQLGFVWMHFTFQFDHGKSSFTKETHLREYSLPPGSLTACPSEKMMVGGNCFFSDWGFGQRWGLSS